MSYNYLEKAAIDHFISEAIKEDVGSGDHSSLASIQENTINTAQLIIKGDGILAGVEMALHIFSFIDKDLEVTVLKKDGEKVKKGDIGLTVSGKAISILTAERLVLNCMQRMSGIATYTNQMTRLIAHTGTKLLDTRKTTPNFRIAEKWAVKIGGGKNHRFGLFDMVMLKDNHNDFAGGISAAVEATIEYLQKNKLDLRIEVETRSLAEVKEALATEAVDVIMLDNMSVEMMTEAITIIDGKCETEASGGITEETIVAIAETGVDYISVGALTHSYKSLDISLKAIS